MLAKKKLALPQIVEEITSESTGNLLNIGEDFQIQSHQMSIVFGPGGWQNAKIKVPFSQCKQIKTLGHGSFGRVFQVEAAGEMYALKELQLSTDVKTQLLIYKELHAYVDYSNKYIISTYNLYSQPNRYVYVLMELAAYGSLGDFVKQVGGSIPEEYIGLIIVDLLRGIQYIHQKQLIHQDIKPMNVLLTAEGISKLGDFGVSTSILANDKEQELQTFAGSIPYMPPECFDEKPMRGKATDIWSAGITIVELLNGAYPYGTLPDIFSAKKLIQTSAAPQPNTQDLELRYLIAQMLNKNPVERFAADKLLATPYCKKVLSQESKLRDAFIEWIVQSGHPYKKMPPEQLKRFQIVHRNLHDIQERAIHQATRLEMARQLRLENAIWRSERARNRHIEISQRRDAAIQKMKRLQALRETKAARLATVISQQKAGYWKRRKAVIEYRQAEIQRNQAVRQLFLKRKLEHQAETACVRSRLYKQQKNDYLKNIQERQTIRKAQRKTRQHAEAWKPGRELPRTPT